MLLGLSLGGFAKAMFFTLKAINNIALGVLPNGDIIGAAKNALSSSRLPGDRARHPDLFQPVQPAFAAGFLLGLARATATDPRRRDTVRPERGCSRRPRTGLELP
jgi:hypothetical protein